MDNFEHDQLTKEMVELTKTLKKSSSFLHSLLVGFGRGIGITIGGMLVTIVVLAILWRVVRTLQPPQFLQPLLGSSVPGQLGQSAGLLELLRGLPNLQDLDPSQFDPELLRSLQQKAPQRTSQ